MQLLRGSWLAGTGAKAIHAAGWRVHGHSAIGNLAPVQPTHRCKLIRWYTYLRLTASLSFLITFCSCCIFKIVLSYFVSPLFSTTRRWCCRQELTNTGCSTMRTRMTILTATATSYRWEAKVSMTSVAVELWTFQVLAMRRCDSLNHASIHEIMYSECLLNGSFGT